MIFPPLAWAAFCRLRFKSGSAGVAPAGSGPVAWRKVAAEVALVMAVYRLAGRAPSIRSNAIRWPPSSTTAMLTLSFISIALACAPAMMTRAPASPSRTWLRNTKGEPFRPPLGRRR